MFNSTQRHRVNRVVNHIRQNVTDPLSLESMADMACLSKYHFLRVFNTQMQETPGQYVGRLRLEKAAGDLIRTPSPNITQIAVGNGFSGSDIFSRAFRNRFGVAPRQFRRLRKDGYDAFDERTSIRDQIYRPGTKVPFEEQHKLDVSIEYRPEYHVAYIRRLGPYGDVNSSINNTYRRLQKWAKSRGILNPRSSFLGQGADDCSITPASYCLYDACLVLDHPIREDDVVSMRTIPGGDFAVLRVVCEPEQVNRLWGWLIGVWIPASSRRLLLKPSYEFFPDWGDHSVCPRRGIELCVPVSTILRGSPRRSII